MADTALIFPSLCFWQYCLYIPSAIFIVVLPVSFVDYIHGYMKSRPNFCQLSAKFAFHKA